MFQKQRDALQAWQRRAAEAGFSAAPDFADRVKLEPEYFLLQHGFAGQYFCFVRLRREARDILTWYYDYLPVEDTQISGSISVLACDEDIERWMERDRDGAARFAFETLPPGKPLEGQV